MTSVSRAWAVAVLTAVVSAGAACHEAATSPSRQDLSGTWIGAGSYPNAPFQLTLTQTAEVLRGSYTDRHDSSLSLNGRTDGTSITFSVDFGDAQLHFEGAVENARRVRGTMRTSALGNTPYPFTMTR